MNGGAYGREVSDILVVGDGSSCARARSIDWPLDELGYTYRHSDLPEGAVVVEATLPRHARRARRRSARRWTASPRAREESQPLRSRTGGSTFKNPPGHKAWALVDAAGCRGLTHGRRASLGKALQFPAQSR